MTPDALTFRIAKHADIVVTGRGVIYRWCDYEGRIHRHAKQLDAQKAPRCAADGTPYPFGFYGWTNGQRLHWLDEHRETVRLSTTSVF